MRDVVVIGGGVCGLVAALELQNHHIPYQLIEVKPHLGGSLGSLRVNGFIFDSGPMWHPLHDAAAFDAALARLGLPVQEMLLHDPQQGVAFKQGAGTFIDVLVGKLSAPVMQRMAVSTLGRFDDRRFSICMENGMLLDAKALIVAVPARYAERMFHTLTPEISYRLLDYRYDTITRVSVGYAAAAHLPDSAPPDYPITGIQTLAHPQRLPQPGGLILQAGVRMAVHDLPADLVGQVAALMDWPLNPDADHIATWAESDPVMWRDPKHTENMRAIGYLLPQGVALAGGDYIAEGPPCLDERIQQGVQAAQKIIAWLRG